MKTAYLLFYLAVMATFIGCSKSEVAPHEDLSLLHERFNGKYKIVTSTTNEAVDINMDGKATTDLLKEIEALSEAKLELRIPLPDYKIDDSPFLFVQFWQNQYLTPANSDVRVICVLNVAVRGFHFSQNIKNILIMPDERPDLMLLPFPDEVTVGSNDNILVVMQKRLYTSNGWKYLKISTLYERYER